MMYSPNVKLIFPDKKKSKNYCLHPVTSECVSKFSFESDQCTPCVPPPFTIQITDRIAMQYNGSKIPSMAEAAGGYSSHKNSGCISPD